MARQKPDLRFEQELHAAGFVVIAGLDEAGRGAWAGPVAAGAVILPLERADLRHALRDVQDSKCCTSRQRDALYEIIFAVAEAVGTGVASAEEIDRMGIVPATRLAMHRALKGLTAAPQALVIDYLRLSHTNLPQKNLVRGEAKSLSIAAASIIAKVTRDRLMGELDTRYPGYGFARHKGYGTPQHREALKELGPCVIHRRSFAPVRLRLLSS